MNLAKRHLARMKRELAIAKGLQNVAERRNRRGQRIHLRSFRRGGDAICGAGRKATTTPNLPKVTCGACRTGAHEHQQRRTG